MSFTIKDIVDNDLCTGCGICVSESDTATMIWNAEGFLVPDISKSFHESAINVCPFNPKPEVDVRDEDILAKTFLKSATWKDERIGSFVNTYVGVSNEYRETSSSGGIATYIFEQLLTQKIVDHLFIVKEIQGNYSYQWFDSAAKIKEISKTRYYPVSLENLFKEIDAKPGKVAVSGVACFIKAIRLKQHYSPQYKEKIPFLVGIICGGLKSSFFSDYLAQKSGIEGAYQKQEYRIKDFNSTASDYSFGAFDDKNNFHQVKMRTVGDMWGSGMFKSNACDFCDDVTTELADISLGDAWLQPYTKEGKGTSVIVTRSTTADQLIVDGIATKNLTVEELNIALFKASQEGSFKHRQKAQKYRIKQKRKQGQLIPQKRERFSQSIPIEFAIVQKQRMKVRKASLNKWQKTQNSIQFERELNPEKTKLHRSTKWYHRIQKLKRKLRLKTV